MKSIHVFCLFCFVLLLSASPSFAFGLGDVASVVSSDGGDVKSLTQSQDEITKLVTSSLLNMAEAQTNMADAFGLKEQSVIAKKNAQDLQSGVLTGSDEMEKKISSTQEVAKAIDEAAKKGEKLDDAGKEKFITAIPYQGKGTLDMGIATKKAIEAGKSLSKVRDLSAITSLRTLAFFSSEAPGLISFFADNTSSMVTFCRDNGIDTKELEEAAAGLGN